MAWQKHHFSQHEAACGAEPNTCGARRVCVEARTLASRERYGHLVLLLSWARALDRSNKESAIVAENFEIELLLQPSRLARLRAFPLRVVNQRACSYP